MASRRGSPRVTRTRNALDLDRGVFARDDPAAIARSLKRRRRIPERATAFHRGK